MTYIEAINTVLRDSLEDPSVVILRQGVQNSGMNLLVEGIDPSRQVIYPVSEALMNSSALGMALAGKRPVLLHVRIDFLATGMDALVNHIPVWQAKGYKLPITFVCQIGRGMGQAAQHSKDLTPFFANFEGWKVIKPYSPEECYAKLKASILGDCPVMFAVHRELFNRTTPAARPIPASIRLCGASRRHEAEFYNGN